MTIDIKDFYLNTPMQRYEYMKLNINIIPEEIIQQYELQSLVHDDEHVYIEIRKEMYGLPQAGQIANDQLQQHLAKYGYRHSKITNGLWTHATNNTLFTLVVDDFRVRYTSTKNFHHLLNALKDLYKITIDWSGSHYIGMDLKWDYNTRTCDFSMKGYVIAALEQLCFTKKKNAYTCLHCT